MLGEKVPPLVGFFITANSNIHSVIPLKAKNQLAGADFF
jgi:hypothetical protein